MNLKNMLQRRKSLYQEFTKIINSLKDKIKGEIKVHLDRVFKLTYRLNNKQFEIIGKHI